MRLSEPIERPGFFWLPQDPEHQVPGILRVSKSGRVTLEISYFYNPSLTLLNAPPWDTPNLAGNGIAYAV